MVNVGGSFLLGFLMHVGTQGAGFPPTLRLALTTGVMGGFTTYSTLNYETTQYMRDGAWLLAGANVGLTVLACFVAGLAGLALARLAVGH